MTGNSHHNLTKGKPCLINPRAFWDKMTGLVDERGAVDYRDISKAFVTVSHKILAGKLKNYGLTLLK